MTVEIVDGVSGVVQECWLYPGSHADRNMGLYAPAWTLTGTTIFTVLKVVLPDFGSIEVVDSKFTLYVYDTLGAQADIYWNRIKKTWNEGTGTSSVHVTLDGEVTYNSARHNEELWEVPGAQGPSDITAQIGSASQTGPNNLFAVPIPIADTQGWHDGDFVNQGILLRSSANNMYWYTSEKSAEYRPKFYMEYIDAPLGWKSNSYYGSRRVASINSPQRSRRVY